MSLKKGGEDKKKTSSWTTDNHLVGNTRVCNCLVPTADYYDDMYIVSAEAIKASFFQADDPRQRRPALWRGLVRCGGQTSLAVDSAASDFQMDTAKLNFPTQTNLGQTTERLQGLILKKIYEEILPDLVVKAALEEVRAHYFKTASAESLSSSSSFAANKTSTKSKTANKSQTPPLYYSKHPNSYLKPPETGTKAKAESAVLIQFTPNHLVNRIKNGCALAWSTLENQRRPPAMVMLPAAIAASERRISSRIARVAEKKQESPSAESTNAAEEEDTRYFWGVISGGSIASYLLDQVMGKMREKKGSSEFGEDSASQTNGEDDKDDAEIEQVVNDEDVDVDIAALENPYMIPSEYAILEWLGRKTAKLLSSSDLQKVFPFLMLHKPTKSKKKKKEAAAPPVFGTTTGRKTDGLLTAVDRQIWKKVSSFLPHDASARFVLESLTHDDVSELDQWETTYFAKTQFALRIVSDVMDESSNLESARELHRLEKEFKDRKAWEVARYKAIHSGSTYWPSWDDAILEWKSKEFAGSLSLENVSTNGKSPEKDLEVARAVAAQEEESNHRSSRRTRRGGDGAVFYGNQSGLSLKQLMEALLRIVSQKQFATLPQLLDRVPDESTDPMRRMRNALGRLVWKRNQLCRLETNTEWTDLPLQKVLVSSSRSSQQLVAAKNVPKDAQEDVQELLKYLAELHHTELQLRAMILENLKNIPLSIIASAGDERPAANESADQSHFEDPDNIEWQRTGHEYIGKDIFRPSVECNMENAASCEWFRIVGFVPSTLLDPEDVDASQDKPQLGSAKDNRAVERRMRFYVLTRSVADSTEEEQQQRQQGVVRLILTEAQVAAGLKASELQRTESNKQVDEEHPFAGAGGARIEILPKFEDSNTRRVHGTVAGWESVCDEAGSVKHTILVLPEEGQNRDDAFKATLGEYEDGCLTCTLEGSDEVVYTVRQFDYHKSSEAFRQCRAMIGHLAGHSKSAPFKEPVDPVALGIPSYFDVIKHPMDISTLSKKLERGDYSNIHPKDSKGRTPVSRMLNGPFREDVELIFDNATTFNPPDDWIYQAAVILKKYILKKIEQASEAADQSVSYARRRPVKGIYVEYDSDVDMKYDGKDEDYDDTRPSRKRKQTPDSTPATAEDTSSRAIERPVKLQKMLGDEGLRGPLGGIEVNSNALSFSLPAGWTCHRFVGNGGDGEKMLASTETDELSELLNRRSQAEEKETLGVRRSTRAHVDVGESSNDVNANQSSITFSHPLLVKLEDGTSRGPKNRFEVELLRERLHEEYFAKIHHSFSANLVAVASESPDSTFVGSFSDDCFPPYLGRVTPVGSPISATSGSWEIRTPNIIPAIRWTIRGLIASGHLAEVEPLTAESLHSGIVLPRNAYYIDPREEPFDVLAQKEINRRKRANQEGHESSEAEVELSEYEKLRAARVARNADYLKALGLS